LSSNDTEELREFLREHVTSFEELEALVYLLRARDRAATCHELAEALHVAEELAEAALAGLTGALVVREGVGSSAIYRLPRGGALEASLKRLQTAYDEQRLTIVQIMTANSMARMRSAAARRLADAFRLERGKK
jgi:hypothetical protein